MLVQIQSGIQEKTKCQQESNWSKIRTGPYNAGILQNQSGIKKKNKCQQQSNWSKIHTGPHNAGIESVWYLGENQMPTGIKLA